MMKCSFTSISEFFQTLNDAGIRYLVMRNYENLLEPEMYVGGHGDIDLLCDDSQAIVRLIDAQPLTPDKRNLRGDGIHYSIEVDGHSVQLDLRQIGDGYYCQKWENELLERRVKHDCFYVMSNEDYFYTLTYHAILQKRSLSDEYRSRLLEMARQLKLTVEEPSEKGLLRLLENHMRDHGYRYTYSKDRMVPNRFNLVDEKLVEKNWELQLYHYGFDSMVTTIERLVKIKHIFSR